MGYRTAAISVALLAFSAGAANAANVVFYPGTDFSSNPATISFGGGAASYTFSYINDGYTADAVSTAGTGLINSSTFPGPGPQPIPFELGTFIGDNGYDTFTAFPSPAGIDYSIAEDSIGIAFQLADGIHYGYVTTLGPEILQYGYNDTVGASIATGAGVPEPTTWALLLAGFGLVGVSSRFKRRVSFA
jgi:PEP-CTERM motif